MSAWVPDSQVRHATLRMTALKNMFEHREETLFFKRENANFCEFAIVVFGDFALFYRQR